MPPDQVDSLLNRLPQPGAERAARWLLWSLIIRRLVLALLPVAALAVQMLR